MIDQLIRNLSEIPPIQAILSFIIYHIYSAVTRHLAISSNQYPVPLLVIFLMKMTVNNIDSTSHVLNVATCTVQLGPYRFVLGIQSSVILILCSRVQQGFHLFYSLLLSYPSQYRNSPSLGTLVMREIRINSCERRESSQRLAFDVTRCSLTPSPELKKALRV